MSNNKLSQVMQLAEHNTKVTEIFHCYQYNKWNINNQICENNAKVLEVDKGTFTPYVFSTSGGMVSEDEWMK